MPRRGAGNGASLGRLTGAVAFRTDPPTHTPSRLPGPPSRRLQTGQVAGHSISYHNTERAGQGPRDALLGWRAARRVKWLPRAWAEKRETSHWSPPNKSRCSRVLDARTRVKRPPDGVRPTIDPIRASCLSLGGGRQLYPRLVFFRASPLPRQPTRDARVSTSPLETRSRARRPNQFADTRTDHTISSLKTPPPFFARLACTRARA